MNGMIRRTNNDLAEVQRFLLRYRRTFVVHSILTRTSVIAAATLSILACLQIVFALFPWVVLPIAWDCCIALGAVAFCIIVCDSAWLRLKSLYHIARLVETRAGLDRPWLSLALELSHPSTLGSAQLTAHVYETARMSLGACSKRHGPPLSPSRLLALCGAILGFGVCSFFLEPSCARYWKMPFSFWRPMAATVKPGTVCLPLRSSCVVGLIPRSSHFPSCRLSLYEEGGGVKTVLLAADASGSFSYPLDSIAHSTVYQFTIGSTTLSPDTITIIPKPVLSRLHVRLVPPSYTGQSPVELPEGQGTFASYPGTNARFEVEASSPLAKVLFLSSGRDTVALAVSQRSAAGAIVVRGREDYTFVLIDTFSQKNDSLPRFSIEAIEDMPPSVYFVHPGANKNCTPAMRDTLLVEAIDDIGISGCSVFMRKNGDTSFVFSRLDVPRNSGNRKIVRSELALDLAGYSLYPGDTLYYWAAARDNKTFGPAHVSYSDTFFFRVPSFEEIHEQVVQEQDQTENAVKSVRKRQTDMKTSLENLLQSTRDKQSLSWEQKQIVSDLEQELKSQADSLSKAMESFKNAIEKMKQDGAADEKLVSKMDEVQKALNDLIRQYGDSLLFAMPKKSDNISMRDMKEALEKFERMLPDLNERLDNTLKFLQALKRDQKLAHLAEYAQKLGEKQQEIASGKEEASHALTKQDQCSRSVDDLLNQIDRSALTNSDSALFSKTDLPSLPDVCSLQKMMKAGLSNKMLPGRGQMNRMAGSLFSLSDNICSLQSSAMMKRLEKERETLLDMTHDALSLSQWQRRIDEEGAKAQVADEETALRQQTLKTSLVKSMDKMNLLCLIPPQRMVAIKKGYDNAALSIDNELSLLSGGAAGIVSAEPELRLNELTRTILDALSQLSSEQSQGGGAMGMMMQGLRRLSGKQAMLNAATGELLRRMLGQGGQCSLPGGEGSREGGKKSGQDEQAKREAQAAQKAIADELKRLADAYGKEAGSSLDKRTRDLEEEARRLARQLEQPSQETQDRQDRFLSRMLETTLSQHKQDEGKDDRVSQSAKTVFSSSQPQAGQSKQTPDSFYRLRQRAFTGNFPESYRYQVKNYFDSLGVIFLKER